MGGKAILIGYINLMKVYLYKDSFILMGIGLFNESEFDSDTIIKLEEYANGLILVLEDIIEIISYCGDRNSTNIKSIKEKYEIAAEYLLDLKTTLDICCNNYKEEYFKHYKKELELYDDKYINDAVTGWILSEPGDMLVDKIFIICYKVRELLRKINNKQ